MAKRILAIIMAFILALGSMTGLDLVCNDNAIEAHAEEDLDKAEVLKDENGVVNLTQSDESYYILAVQTGSTAGDDVEYFAIRYIDENNQKRTEFVFPHVGAREAGYNQVETLMKSKGYTSPAVTKEELVKKTYGVYHETQRSTQELLPNTIDEYFFTPLYTMASIDSIEVCASAGEHRWFCAGISLYRVDKLRGVDMMGYYSDERFIDFVGVTLARAVYNNNINTNKEKGTVVRFDKNSTIYKLDTGAIVHNFADPYAIKIDIAQTAGAGIDAFIQDATQKRKISDRSGIAGYQECLTLHIMYTDIGELKRELYVPLCTNLLCYIAEHMKKQNECIYGIGQDSDSIVIPLTLPGIILADDDYRALDSITLTYSNEYAVNKCNLKYAGTPKPVKNKGNEFVSIDGVQFLKYMPDMELDTQNNKLKVDFSETSVMFYYAKSVYNLPYDEKKDNASGMKISSASFETHRAGDNTKFRSGVSDDTYYFELDIHSAPDSQTLDDIIVNFVYVNNDGRDVTSRDIIVNQAVNDFYGNWVTTSGILGESGAYQIKAIAGGKLTFMVQLEDVSRFVAMNVRTSSKTAYMSKLKNEAKSDSTKESIYQRYKGILENDDFQLAGVTIKKFLKDGLGGLEYRYTDKAVTVNGAKTNWNIERDCMLADTEYAKYIANEKIGINVLPDKEGVTIYFNETTRIENEDTVDWYEYRDSMTFAETKQDFDYTKRRCTYEITVDVPSDKGNETSMGDSGSKNQFYFMLMFETGNTSGYVLANQQLASDCFNSGNKETFTIYTNCDYGDVVGVRIIPDAQQDNADIYDKLKIADIVISRRENSVTKNWTCEINDWVGIDYTDDGAAVSAKGQRTKSEAEIARTYAVDKSSYDANLIFEIVTGEYLEDNNQPTGGLNAKINYIDEDGASKSITVDVYKAMYEYMKLTTKYSEGGGFAQIDPENMLKPATSNYFEQSIQRIKKLVSIEFTPKSPTEDTTWSCDKVIVSQVIGGTGGLYRNDKGVRARDYDTLDIATSIDNNNQNLSIFKGNSSVRPLLINFESTEVSLNSTVNVENNEGKINDDSLNIYVHRVNEKENEMFPYRIADVSKYDMGVKVRYTYNAGKRGTKSTLMQLDKMSFDVDSNMFYCSIATPGLREMGSMDLNAKKKGTLQELASSSGVYIDYAIIEHVRNHAIVGTYKVVLRTETDITEDNISLTIRKTSGIGDKLSQKLILSLGGSTDIAKLNGIASESMSDIGVVLKYKSTWATKVGSDEIYNTPIKYLSGVNNDGKPYTIKPHQLIEMEFNQNNVDEIVGVEVYRYNVAAEVNCVSVSTFSDDSTQPDKVYSYYVETGAMVNGTAPEVINTAKVYDRSGRQFTDKSAGFLWMEINTGSSDESFGQIGQQIPVRAEISWADEAGNNSLSVIENINTYCVEGAGIMPGESAKISVPLQSYGALHSIKLIPYAEDSSSAVSWILDSVSISVLNPVKSKVVASQNRKIGTKVAGSTGGITLNFANISFGGVISYSYTSLSGSIRSGGVENFVDGKDIRVNSGSIVTLEANSEGTIFDTDKNKFIRGSFEDIEVIVQEVYGDAVGERTETIDGNVTLYTRTGNGYQQIIPGEYQNKERPVISKIEFIGTSVENKDVVYLLTLRSTEMPDYSITFRITVAGIPKEEETEIGEFIDGGDDRKDSEDEYNTNDDGIPDNSENDTSPENPEDDGNQNTPEDANVENEI